MRRNPVPNQSELRRFVENLTERLIAEAAPFHKPARDPNRILPLLTRIAAVWAANPDERLGQLVANAARVLRHGDCDPFYIEDEELVREIEQQAVRTRVLDKRRRRR